MRSALYLVAGLGKTGHSIARFLQKRNQPFVVFDTRIKPSNLAEFYDEFPCVDVFLSELPASIYEQLIAVISSPGVALDQTVMQKISNMGLPIYGDIECLAREVQSPVIAITGTNGKSTVTTLVGEMAKAAGLSVAVAGNIGAPVLDLLDDEKHYDLWVLELSSFQLDLTTTLAPLAATVLNVTPDHLDRHHTFDAYLAAKQRVYNKAQFLVYNRDDEFTFPPRTEPRPSGSGSFSLGCSRDSESLSTCDMIQTLKGQERSISSSFGMNVPNMGCWGLIEKDAKTYLAYGNNPFLCVDELRIKGQHNWLNALAASALAHAAGIELSYITMILKRFAGLPHRCQWVRTHYGVDWINDSKGTNIGATVSAISGIGGSMQGKIVLIAGGQGKGADFTQLRACVAEHVRCVVLIGEDAHKIEHAVSDIVPVVSTSTLDEAVILAAMKSKPGDVVLLSPACASLDMFRDFNHRGEVFAASVNAL